MSILSIQAVHAAMKYVSNDQLGRYHVQADVVFFDASKVLHQEQMFRIVLVAGVNQHKIEIPGLQGFGLHSEFSTAFQEISWEQSTTTLTITGRSERHPDGYKVVIHLPTGH